MITITNAPADFIRRSSGLASLSSDYTVLFWWFHGATPAAAPPISYRTAWYMGDDPVTSYLDSFWIGQNAGGAIRLAISDAGVNVVDIVGSVIDPTTTDTVAYVRSGNTHSLYINNVLVGSGTADVSALVIDRVMLGSDEYGTTGAQAFYRFREFTSALTTDEMAKEFASLTAVAANPWTDTPLYDDLLDDSGNGHDWTNVSGVFSDTPTRYYPSLIAPTAIVHGPMRGEWDGAVVTQAAFAPVQWTWQLSATKASAGLLGTITAKTNQQGDHDTVFDRWVTMPLEAQTIEGTFDMCFQVQATWISGAALPTNDSIVRYKVHVYVAVGQTTEVRGVLLDNYVDSVNWPGTSGAVWRQLAAPQNLNPVVAQAGDTIVIELGARIVSSPTPIPDYPPEDWTSFPIRGIGTNNTSNVPYADAVAGDTSSSRAPWFQFSMPIAERASSYPDPPANDACANAIEITEFPFESGEVITSASTDTERRIWYKFTAPTSGWYLFQTFGTNYRCEIRCFQGTCGSLLNPDQIQNVISFRPHRSQSYSVYNLVQGTEYFLRISDASSASTTPNSAANGGGVCRIRVSAWDDPAEDDLYIPSGTNVLAIRNGVVKAATPVGVTVTGVAFDYTRRPMVDIEDGSINTSVRVLVGTHDFNLIEIIDAPTLSLGRTEVDFIGDPFVPVGVRMHPAQLFITRTDGIYPAGRLFIAWFGNGYRHVEGEGTLPAIYNSVSSDNDLSGIRWLSATDGDNQPGAPFSDTLIEPVSVEPGAPWSITADETTGLIYFVCGGFYVPIDGGFIGSNEDQIIKRVGFDGNDETPFPALDVPDGTLNRGLKGMEFLPGGGLLVSNGPQIMRLNSVGTVIQTYTPSIPMDATTIVDLALTANGTRFWAIDLYSTRLFLFDITTGVEVATYQPYIAPSTLIQMAIYQPDGAEPPPDPEPPEGDTATLIVRKEVDGGGPTPFDFVGGGLTPEEFSLTDGGVQTFTDLPAGTYSVEETPIPDGWELLSTTVSNGDDPSAITLAAGDVVEVIFRNGRIGGPQGPGENEPAPSTLNATVLRMRRLRRTAFLSEEEFRIFYHRLQIDMQVGVGLGGAEQQGSNPQIMLRWSDDGGNTWSNEHWITAGRVGMYGYRALWNRLGMGRSRLFEVVVSDPVAWRLVEATIQVLKGNN